MTNKSTNTTLLILTILLCLVVIGLGAYTYSFHTKVKDNETQLVKNKELIKAELEEEIGRYSLLLKEKNALSSELIVAKERLEAFQKKIDSNEITRSTVHRYQLEIRQLRKEWKVLLNQNDSLQQETRRLSNLQERTQNSLDSITKVRDIQPVKKVIKDAPVAPIPKTQVTITDLQSYGVIQRSSGKFVNTARASRAQMIRVCYVVNMVEALPASERVFYVRVLAENNKLIGIKRKITLDTGEELSYNTETSIKSNKQTHKICELALPVSAFSKGAYKIEIYNSKGFLQSTNLTLK